MLVVALLVLLVLAIGPLVFGLYLLNPAMSLGLICVIAILAIWRGYSIIDAARPRTAVATIVALALIGVTAASHAWLANNAYAFYEAGQRISQPVEVALPPPDITPEPEPSLATPEPGQTAEPPPTAIPSASPLPSPTERVTVLLVGVDNTHAAERGLTDTLILASFDPIAESLTMISLPRDTARLPFYRGGEFRPRINNLLQTAARNPEQYPDGPMETLVAEMSYIMGIPIDYYAQIDIAGFTELVDMVGGVDVVLDGPIQDETYQFSPTETGFFLDAGYHHLDGKTATAYARSRHGPGNSDYERARRQQQILLALRSKMNDPGLMTNLPGLLHVLSNIIRTNAPLDQLPEIVSIAMASTTAEPTRIVLAPPRYAERVFNSDDQATSMTTLDMDAIADLSVQLFGRDSRYSDDGLR